MKRVNFTKLNRSGNLLHIETEGCIVNIRVGLHNVNGNQVTSIEIIPDEKWDLNGLCNTRVRIV